MSKTVKKKSKRTRGWCYTINNPTDGDIALAMSLYEDSQECTYNIMAFETAPRTGTKHIQGYVYYRTPRRFKHMQKKLAPHHIESQKCFNAVSAYAYCMKSTTDVYEQGERPRQGHRTDLDVIKFDIEQKKNMKIIAKEYFSQWCQYRRSFDEYKKMYVKYDTKMYHYSPEDIGKFGRQDLSNSLVICEYDAECCLDRVLLRYYSGLHDVIYIPSRHYEIWRDRLYGVCQPIE